MGHRISTWVSLLWVCLAALHGCTGNASGGAANASASGKTSGDQSGATTFGATTCAPGNPYAQPLLRLSQQQYVSSVQDIFNVTLPTLDLPNDDAAGPFAANYASSVTDLSVEQYQGAASIIAGLVANHLAAVAPCAASAMTTACAAQITNALGKRVFRRPLDSNEVAQYTSLVAASVTAGDSNQTVQLLVQAMLQSPYFVYRPESGTSTANAQTRLLTPYEASTRLAYVLWGSTPDTALLEAADSNEILDDASFAQQANRMLDDPRFAVQMTRFAQQLLALQGLATATKDPNLYPNYNPALEAAMAQETGDFVSHVLMVGDARWETLLTAPYSVVTPPLLPLYGVSASATAADGTTAFDATQRAGLLTQAAFLTDHSHGNAQPAVVLRGKVVRENLLCQGMPAPPANVMPLPSTIAPNATARVIFAAHESNASCAACHSLMDPIGLSFETYDGIGTYRTKQGSNTIDASGDISGSQHTDVSFANAVGLASVLASSSDVHACVVTQATRFAMSRDVTAADACDLQTLASKFEASEHNMRQLMYDIVMLPNFRKLGTN